jgi:hypothetical protein
VVEFRIDDWSRSGLHCTIGSAIKTTFSSFCVHRGQPQSIIFVSSGAVWLGKAYQTTLFLTLNFILKLVSIVDLVLY